MYLDLTIRYAKSLVARLRIDFYRSLFYSGHYKGGVGAIF